MKSAPSPARRALVALIVLALGASAAVTATSVAVAAPAPPTIPAPAGGLTAVGEFPTVTVQLATESTGVSTGRVIVSDGAGGGATCTAPVAVGVTTFDCVIGPLSPGTYQVTAQYSDLEFPVDGDWSAESAPVTLRLGTAGPVTFTNFTGQTNEWGTRTPLLAGTGPVFGSVEVFFTYNIFDGNGVQTISYCSVENIPVSGLWSCQGSALPSWASDSVSFFATGETVTGSAATLPAASAFINPIEGEVLPPPPTSTYVLDPGSITVTLEGLPGHVVYGDLIEIIDVDYTRSFTSQPCPQSGPPQNISTCTYSGLTPGIWNFSHLQEESFFSGFDGEHFIRIPEAPGPLSASDNPDGSVLFSGSGQPGSTVHVRDAADNTVCSGLVAGDATWDCTGTPPAGTALYRATQEATGFVATPPADFGGFEYRSLAGFSAYTDEVLVAVPPGPTPVTITPTPGGARIVATGNPGSEVVVDIFPASLSGDPLFPYDFGSPLQPGCTTLPLTASIDCTRSLGPGVWGVYVRESLDEMQVERDHLIQVPSAPASFSATVRPDRSVQFTGSGQPGFSAEVFDLVDDSLACSAMVQTDGTWQCTTTTAPGPQTFRAVQRSIGFAAESYESLGSSTDGVSPLSDAVSVIVPAPPTVPPPTVPPPARPVPTPAPTPTPIVWTLEGYDGSPLLPGQTLDLSARGLPPQTVVAVEIRSTPRMLGSATADDLGVFALTVTVPEDLEAGDHTLVATATPPGGVPSEVRIPVVVQPVEQVTDGEGAEPVAAPPGGSDPGAAGGGAGDRSDPAAPSAITSSIPTLQRLFDDPWVVAAGGGLALALLLLVALPAELLNSTLSSNTGRLGRWFVAIERRAERVTEWVTRVSRTRALAAAVLVGLTSLIFGFVDPEYGFDPVSVRMTVSLAIGLFLITYVAAWISGAIVRRAWGVETEVTLQPVALLFAVVGVVIARILEFSPGFLIGLVIGLDLLSRVDAAVRARVVVLSTSVTVGIAVAAWLGFSALTALSSGTPGWVELLISDALVATTAEGLTAAIASLLPLGFLAGHEVFRHSKPLWAGTFIVVATLFALIVLPTAAGETAAVEDMAFWMLVMAVFAAVTLTLWALLQFTGNGSRDGDEDGAGEGAEKGTAEQAAAAAAR